jgi:UDP-4-amino-4-deoxy-L-arabinose formyltransferase / UDP-glucuronic acid dehydrogenase (UDP-4-keto-hexauronic acid decarboxylating)
VLKVVLLGWGTNASDLLERLVAEPGYDVVGVVPRVAQSTVPSDVEFLSLLPTRATELSVPIYATDNVNHPSFVEELKRLESELLINWGHNQLFGKPLLAAAKNGCANIHPGLLPYGRGSGAVFGEVMNGRYTVGQTIHLMDETFDGGEIVLQRSFTLKGSEYLDEINELFQKDIVEFYFEALERIRQAQATRKVEGFGTYYPRMAQGDGIIDWSLVSEDILKRIQLRSPTIPSITFLEKTWREVHLWRVERSDVEHYRSTPGQILFRDPDKGILVKTGDGAVWVTQISEPGGEWHRPNFPIGTTFVNNWIQEIRRLREELGVARRVGK